MSIISTVSNLSCALHKVRATVLCRKVELIITAQTVPVPHRGEPRTHGRESGIGFFDVRWVVLEMRALLATWPGTT